MMRWLALMLLMIPMPAMACLPPLPPEVPPTQAEIDGGLRNDFATAADFIEFRVIVPATPLRTGIIEVRQSFKGRVARGARLRPMTLDSGMCGWGNVRRGTHGHMLLTGKSPYLYVGPGGALFADFTRLGLVPAR